MLFMHNRWVRFAVLVAGWAFVGFVLSIEIYFNTRAGMKWGYIDFVDIAIPQFGRAVMWALQTPYILELRTEFPLSRGRRLGGITFHLGMSFVVMATFYLGRLAGYALTSDGFDHFWRNALHGFYGRNIIDMGFYWTVIAVGYSTEIYRRYRTEELKAAQLETRLIETELKALREQLHPHFLFNTMNTISVLVREGKNAEAVNLIARLSALLRRTLDGGRAPEITLREELDFLDHYVEIQKARFSDRLTVNTVVAPEALEARIPSFLLQPLVENAILHGIAPKAGPGRVDVVGRVHDGRLYLDVCDDGPGLDPRAGRAQEGIGLSNTRSRLEKIYGAAGQLSLCSEPGRGVTVEIVIPYRP